MQVRNGSWRLRALGWGVAALIAGCGGGSGSGYQASAPPPRLSESHSAPLVLTSDGARLWSVNPDADTVSVLDVAADHHLKLAELPVGREPRCVAITPDNKKVYVTNAVSGDVTVIDAASYQWLQTIRVGAEPKERLQGVSRVHVGGHGPAQLRRSRRS